MITAKEVKLLVDKTKANPPSNEELKVLQQMCKILYKINGSIISGTHDAIEVYGLLPDVRNKLLVLGFGIQDIQGSSYTGATYSWISW